MKTDNKPIVLTFVLAIVMVVPAIALDQGTVLPMITNIKTDYEQIITRESVSQPDGTIIPSEMGCSGGRPTGLLPLFACICTESSVCNIGVPCTSPTDCDNGQNGICESTLWHAYNDNTCIPSQQSGLNPITEAVITAETFYPTGPLTFKLLSRRSTIFMNAFGWYNVTGASPGLSDLHVTIDCNAALGDLVVFNILADPQYTGGKIGFFLVTPESHSVLSACAGGDCCGSTVRLSAGAGYTFFSERSYNPDYAGAQSYIHLLTYASHLVGNKHYFAWGDKYNGPDNNEFTSMVVSVDNITTSTPSTSTTTTATVTTTTISTDTTTTTINANTTTTTTIKQCPSRNALGDDKQSIEQLQAFRDKTLAQSAIGRMATQIYYNNADSINATLDRSPALRAFTRKVLEAVAPLVGRED